MEDKTPFAEFLEDFLRDERLSVAEFADRIGRDKAAVRRWLYGLYVPSAETVVEISAKFRISSDYMFGLSDKKSVSKICVDKDFYSRYVKLRSAVNANDYGISEECGISDGTVSGWKKLKGMPEMDSLLKLTEFFGCSLDYLLGISAE